MSKEIIWKDVIGYEGYYKISSSGQVVSLSRVIICKNGHRQTQKEKTLNATKNNKGYLRFFLCKNGTKKIFSYQRIMAIHFIPNPNNLPIVRHKDDNKLNNDISNLEWGTNKDNSDDMVKRGRSLKGERNHQYGKKGELSTCYGRVGDKNPMFGNKRGKCVNSKLVLNTQNGVFYDCVADAADSVGVKYNTLVNKLNGNDKNNTPFIYA
jgi:hypothetical protein